MNEYKSNGEHLSFAKSIFFIVVRASPLAYYTRERGRSHYKCKTEMLPSNVGAGGALDLI